MGDWLSVMILLARPISFSIFLCAFLLSGKSDANPQAMTHAMLAVNSTCRALDYGGSLPTGLVGYWKLDEPAGAMTTVDSSATAGPAATLGAGVVMGSTGKVRNAAQFDGTGAISIADSATYKPAFPFTMSAWFQSSALGPAFTNVYATDRFDSSIYNGALIGFEATGQVAAHIGDGSGAGINSRRSRFTNAYVVIGKWVHVVSVFTNINTIDVYVNGVLSNNGALNGTASSMATTANSSRIGGPVLGERRLSGLIDEVTLWNRALTATEIKTIHSNQACGRN